jgi:hypothetical protein
MEKHLIVITTSAFMLLGATMTASAQSTATPPASQQQLPTYHGGPGMIGPGMMGPGMMGDGMMGEDMMGGGMMRRGMMRRGMMEQRPIPGAVLRFIFALIDSDGDGTVSLQEFQAAHERIFKAIDANKDGVLTLEEIQAFMRGQASGQTGGQTRSGPQH